MDNAQTRDACLVDSFKSTYPKFKVGIDGVLHQNGYIHTLEGIGHFLNGKGIGSRAGSDPQQVDSGIEASLNVLTGGYFSAHLHAQFLLHALQPRKGGLSVTLKASGFGAGLPHAGTENLDAFLGQLRGSGHHLLFGFCRTGSGNDNGTVLIF